MEDLLAWVAVQKHSGGGTSQCTTNNHHRDSLLRIVNIGITLQNSRKLWVAKPNTHWKNRTAIDIQQGSVYVAAPTAFDHHPEFAKIDIKEQIDRVANVALTSKGVHCGLHHKSVDGPGESNIGVHRTVQESYARTKQHTLR